jgi:hypothetical protein
MELLHVSIYNKDDESRVEKLTKECTFYDRTLLLGYSVLADPRHEQNNTLFQNCVDGNNNHGNGECEHFGVELIVTISEANRFGVSYYTVGIL